ncbi:MAG: hypothetical protein GY834_01420 [Bacteroidetes bacterium]|nr:hypothetical protein [Bacteroidota bacterium]
MSKLTLDIKPKVGFGEIDFGFTIEQTINLIGEAEEIKDLQDEEDLNVLIMSYLKSGYSVLIEGKGAEKSVVSCFETDNEEAKLFGKKVFNLKEEEIIVLMKANGYKEIDAETEENEEHRLSFEDAMIDFFFEDKELIAVNWGVLVNEHGEIEDF